MKTIRTFLFVLLVAVIATGLAACAPAAAPAPETAAEPAAAGDTAAPAAGGTLVIAMNLNDVVTLDPALCWRDHQPVHPYQHL